MKREGWQIGRRSFLGLAGGAVAATLAEPGTAAAQSAKPSKSTRPMVASKDIAVVDTAYGKVRGFEHNGIFTFKGIPYADTTGGTNRFTVAKKPKPWTGIRTSMYFGQVCPQGARDGWNHDEESWMMHWDDGIPGENCLRINIWTPGVNDNRKRTVMFWIHGGGYTAGSGQELPNYDGEQLARRGDVVVVSINHRLNVLGFLNLEKYGEQFKNSSNVGMLDIVQALEWVKENIAGFGGDPNSVMIFGQSGGGGKVAYLMGMPSAKGLFHRAIIESGSQPREYTLEASGKVSDMLLQELQITPGNLGELQTMPYARLSSAATRVLNSLRIPTPPNGLRRSGAGVGWAPVTGTEAIPTVPFYPAVPEQSAKMPLLIGSTLNEFMTATDHPEYELMTEDELHAKVEAALPGKGSEAIAIYRKSAQGLSPFDVWSRMNATTAMRRNAVDTAKVHGGQGAPAYLYQFRWQTPVLDGRPRAFHCSEITFAFDNVDRCETMTGGGEDAHALAAKVSEAWIAFAKTGDPNHKGLPKWEPVTKDKTPTMYLDNTCELKMDPDAEELRITL